MIEIEARADGRSSDFPALIAKTLERLRTAEVGLLPVEEIRTQPSLQPRDSRLVPCRDKANVERSSTDHVHMLRLVLEDSQNGHLDPVLVAEIADAPDTHPAVNRYLVDGHHRLDAYRKAKRVCIPARLCRMSYLEAVLISKLVNCTGRALAMHGEQRLEAAWQYLAAVTNKGATKLPVGESLRSIAASFGIGKSSVSRMLPNMSGVNLSGFPAMTRDPGTGWPRWRYVRQPLNGWHTPLIDPYSEESLQREAEKLAKTIVELMGNSTPQARARAIQILAGEQAAPSGPVGALDFLGEIAKPYGTDLDLVLSHWDNRAPS